MQTKNNVGLDKVRLIWLVAIGVGVLGEVKAQYCLNQYQEAQQLYEDGRINAVLEELDSCLNHPNLTRKLSKTSRVELFKLAAHAHILLDEPEEALKSVYKVLADRPFYSTSSYPNDHLMFTAVIDTTTADPKWVLGVRGGINATLVKSEKSYSILEFDGPEPARNYAGNLADQKLSQMDAILGFHFSLMLEYVFWSKNLALAIEPGFSKIRYEYQIAYPELSNSFSATQKLNYFDLPILLKYKVLMRKAFQPYVQVGFSNRFLISANKEISSQFRPSVTSSTAISRKTPETPVTSLMSEYIYGAVFGAGLNWDWKLDESPFLRNSSLSLDLRYNVALENANNPSKRFLNNDLSDVFIFEYYDVADDIKLRNWEISLVLRHNLRYKVFSR